MMARIVGRELARLTMVNKKYEVRILEWATSSGPTSSSQPEVYGLLNDLTKRNARKVLRFSSSQSSASSDASTSEASSPSASTSSSTDSYTPTHLSLQRFDEIAREAFLRTTAISKVPLWDDDLTKYEDMFLHGKENKDSVPVTVPGQGRKLWAGQEDFTKRYSPAYSPVPRTLKENEEGWEDVEEAQLAPAQERKERGDKWTKKRPRHAEGRNGNLGQRSAIARSKGHQAPPRSESERKLMLDMPVTSI